MADSKIYENASAKFSSEQLLRDIFSLCEEVIAGGQTSAEALEKIHVGLTLYASNSAFDLHADEGPQNSDTPF